MRTPAPPSFWRGGQNAKTVKDVPKSFVPAAAEKSCVSSVGSGAEAPAGAGQSPPGVQRAEPFGARRIGAGVQRAEPFGARRIGAGVQRAEPFGARRIGAGTYGVPSAMRRNSSSVSTGMPRSAAFCSFEPAASPATT